MSSNILSALRPGVLCCAVQALLANNSITELTIRGNDLGDEGVEALATALIVSVPGLGGRGAVSCMWVCCQPCVLGVLAAVRQQKGSHLGK